MKQRIFSGILSTALAFTAVSLVGTTASAKEKCHLGAKVETSAASGECLMVFARVGESFEYDLQLSDETAAPKCTVGLNAEGEVSVLPAGLSFDKSEGKLHGVPQRAGFHEFVFLSTEQGVTNEQVVLIDIQGLSLDAGGSDYASYFSGGVR